MKPGTARNIDRVVFAACLALLGAVGASAVRNPPRTAPVRSTPIGTLPAQAALVVTLDVKQLQKSALGAELIEATELPGVGKLSELCGYDPLANLHTLAIVVPEARMPDEAPEFGVAAFGPLDAERVVDCAARVVRKRGGTAAITRVGSFTTFRDRKQPGGELAVREGGPLLIGGGRYLLELIDAADGRAPNLRSHALHPALRHAVGEDGAAIASFVVPQGFIERLADTELARLSPLSGIRALAVRLDVEPRIALRLVIGCTPQATCDELSAVLQRLQKRELLPLLERELGTEAAGRLELSRQPNQLHISLSLEEREASALAARWLERARGAEPAAPTPSPTLPDPDEIVRPSR